jgi:dolichol-phosphate mannosyltransferase
METVITRKIAVVIPAYEVVDHIQQVISSIPADIDFIIVVDDKCPLGSGKKAEELNREDIIVLYHQRNEGVGGAVITGYKKALELGCDIVVKIDGDGQMDPMRIREIIRPLIEDKADYAKGNRFRDFKRLKSMPKVRLFGNSILSFLVKVTSGYWNIMDPTNGFTAIRCEVLSELNMDKLSKRFFFESDMLINLNVANAVVADIPMPAQYGEERSSLKISRVLFQFPPRLLKGFIKRIFLKYFVYDFNMASMYTLLGVPIFLFGLCFGVSEWIDSMITGEPRSAGTIMLAALPIIVSFQMLLQAINIDIISTPKKK